MLVEESISSRAEQLLTLEDKSGWSKPVIFASALLSFPQIISQLLTSLTATDSSFIIWTKDRIFFLGTAYQTGDAGIFSYMNSFT
jgi:preprotein translocase subunit SecY